MSRSGARIGLRIARPAVPAIIVRSAACSGRGAVLPPEALSSPLRVEGVAGPASDSAAAKVGALRRQRSYPGIAAAVAADGVVVWRAMGGVADLESQRPVSDRTQFPIGSVSKPLTAALALRQQERSALDLDRVVRT
jgi:CubicO group peptidase (beta-lactamase class C family)